MFLPDFEVTPEHAASAEQEIARVMAGNGGNRDDALDLLAHVWAELIAEDAASNAAQWPRRVAEWVHLKRLIAADDDKARASVVSREPVGIAEVAADIACCEHCEHDPEFVHEMPCHCQKVHQTFSEHSAASAAAIAEASK